MNSVHRYVGCLAAVLASPDNNLKRLKICGGCDSDVQVFGGYGFGGEEARNYAAFGPLTEGVA